MVTIVDKINYCVPVQHGFQYEKLHTHIRICRGNERKNKLNFNAWFHFGSKIIDDIDVRQLVLLIAAKFLPTNCYCRRPLSFYCCSYIVEIDKVRLFLNYNLN